MKKEYLLGGLIGVAIVIVLEVIVGLLLLRTVMKAANVTVQDIGNMTNDVMGTDVKNSNTTDQPSTKSKPDTITVNGKALSTFQMIALKAAAGDTEIPPGDYWYNAETGEFGLEGQAAIGTGPKGLEL